MVKILVVDNLPAVRSVLKLQIELDENLRVIGEADNSRTALNLLPHIQPDVVLIDLDMPDMDGISLTHEMNTIAPQMPIIILSLNDDPVLRHQAAKAGAVGFIVKQGNTVALRHLICQVANRESRNFQPGSTS